MNRLKLFRVEHEHTKATIFIAASSPDDVVAIYVSAEVAAGRVAPDFSVERCDHSLPVDMQVGLDEMLAQDPAGVATYDHLLGWSAVRPG